MGIVIPFILIFFACLVIWRACDGFEVASEYIGRNMSEGVRGGTINAVSSSIPELFTTLIALFALSDKDGFAMGIGTTAGSALFNGMIIPAVCILSVVGSVVLGKTITSVNVSTKVVLRDGISLIICQIVLILLINGTQLHWWQGLILMALYGMYLAYMLLSMKSAPLGQTEEQDESDSDEDTDSRSLMANAFYWLSGGPLLNLEDMFVSEKQKAKIQTESWNGWPLLLTSTAIIGIACWALVKACEWLGTGPANSQHPSYTLFGSELTGLGMPAMFVAVIFASMATSVPDTVMSIRDARDGDYDDAVANALGSNIFDICFALGFPLFLYTLINGPIPMSGDVAVQSGELRLLLLVLTIVGFVIYVVGKRGVDSRGNQFIEMKQNKAYALLAIYVGFVVYIVGRSQEHPIAERIAETLQSLLLHLPSIG